MRIFWFFGLFYGSLGLGWLFRRFRHLSPKIMRAGVFLMDAPIFIYSFWILDLERARQYAPIPLFALLLMLLGLGLSPLWARRLSQETKAQGSFVLASSFSNIGNTGGMFICYLLYGLPGLALGSLFLLPYPLLVFSLGFSAARKYASGRSVPWRETLAHMAKDLLSLIPIGAMALGFALNLLRVPVPHVLDAWAEIWVRLGLVMSCLAIGMTLEARHWFTPWRPVWAGAAVKFLISPAVTALLLLAVYGSLSGLAPKVILIQSAMPPAIYSVITANLFNLDRDLANSLWLSNTLLLIPVALAMFMWLG